MDSLVGPCSIMKEISKTEEAIKNCYERIDRMESKLKSNQVPENKKSEVETELAELRKLLATNEEQLFKLHKHNSKSFIFAVSLMTIGFTCYVLYIMVGGKDF